MLLRLVRRVIERTALLVFLPCPVALVPTPPPLLLHGAVRLLLIAGLLLSFLFAIST
jgi:hypothetical protein